MPADPLTLPEREEIRAGIERHETITATARRLGRHRSTISREIRRNGGRHAYRASRADTRATTERARPKTRLLTANPALRAHVAARLEAKDSPMTIARELPIELGTVSHETIYQGVYRPRSNGLPAGLHRHLHRRHRRRKHRRNGDETVVKPGPLGVFQPITARPPEAAGREVVGHLEGDLIIGAKGRSALITVFDRASRRVWLADLPEGHNATAVLAGLIEILDRIPARLRKTLTWDQGREMARWRDLAELTGIAVFFADPHSPWQRPTNENGNGLLRRYVGKGTNLRVFKPADLRAIEHRLNTMPRRVLHWSTAANTYDHAVAMTG